MGSYCPELWATAVYEGTPYVADAYALWYDAANLADASLELPARPRDEAVSTTTAS